MSGIIQRRQPLALGTQASRSKPLSAARLVNLYMEPAPLNSRAPKFAVAAFQQTTGPSYGTPGLKAWKTIGSGKIRAMRLAIGYLWVLSGAALYRVSSVGTATLCTGDSIASTGVAMITDNGVQLTVLSNGSCFVVSGTTVTRITADAFPAAGVSSIDYIDSYTVFSTANSGQWFISSGYDSATLDPLDFATSEANPDNIVRILVDHREVWIFNERSIEVWTDAGTSPFPFARIPGAISEKGCAAALSPAKVDNTVYWLGDDLIVYAAAAYSPQRISNFAIEEQVRQMATVSDAFGLTYVQGGHSFYALTFPTAGKTFVYDAATQVWHERQSGTSTVGGAWAPNCLVAAFGKIYAGTSGGKVAELDLDTFAEHGLEIRRVAVTPPIYADGKRAILTVVELECELGTGIATGQGSDPQVMLRWSDDGGATWSNEHWAPLGPTGQRRKRAIWRRLGMFRQRELEFSFSDPVKVCLYGMRYEAVLAAA